MLLTILNKLKGINATKIKGNDNYRSLFLLLGKMMTTTNIMMITRRHPTAAPAYTYKDVLFSVFVSFF